MRCKGCGYSLWNVPGRTCPECGRAFAPSEFEFRPNAVEFCCPGCLQQYYGTGADGLPVPREFPCVRCGHACSLDAMVLRLAPGATDELADPARVPWEREGIARWRRLLGTVRDAMVRPSALGRGIAADHSASPALAARFALSMALLSAIPFSVLLWALEYLVPAWTSSSARSAALTGKMWGAAALHVAVAAAISLAAVAALALASAASWGVLRALGERVPRWTVWRCLAYSSGALLLLCVPVVGVFCITPVIGVWWAVSAVIVVANGARVPAWKAAAAVLLPPAATALALVAGLFAFAEWRTGSAAPAPAAGQAATQQTGQPPAQVPDGNAGAEAPESASQSPGPAGSDALTPSREPPAAPPPPSP